MYQLICDLCGYPIKEKHRQLKIKEFKDIPFQWQEIDAHDECVKAVAAAATRKGRWRNALIDCQCSLCGIFVKREIARVARFCPYCGAKMVRSEE